MRTHKHTPSPLFLPLPSPGILTLPVQFCSAALCRDVGTVRGNIRSLSGTQVCRGKVLNLVITLAIVLLCFIHKGSCVQRPRRGFVEKGGCRERRRHRQEDHIKNSFQCPRGMLDVRQTSCSACRRSEGLDENQRTTINPGCENMAIR